MAHVGESRAEHADRASRADRAEATTEPISQDHVPTILARPEHTVSRKDISGSALKVLYRLHHAGYTAYLVGGGVRDLLLGRRPKDFDVGTNARPSEIRRLFRNSRIIGRRFRLVHVFFKGETVEVSTFRASPEAPDDADDWSDEQEELRENEELIAEGDTSVPEEVEVFGTPIEDAHRRDLTVNALFYDIANFSVIDHVGGLPDLEARIIRTIGPPRLRFEEDPVRMMRALEYAVRLSFQIDEETDSAIHDCSEYITEATSARLTYELMETLGSGHAAGICAEWQRHGILERAFPEAAYNGSRFIDMLGELDRRRRRGRRLPTATMVGTLFLPKFVDIYHELVQGESKLDNVVLLTRLRELLEPPCARMRLSNHTVHLLNNGLFAISKLRKPPERGRQVIKLARQDSFPVMWDLYSLGVASGALPRTPAYDAWNRAFEQLRKTPPGHEPKLMLEGRERQGKRRPRRRPRRRRRT